MLSARIWLRAQTSRFSIKLVVWVSSLTTSGTMLLISSAGMSYCCIFLNKLRSA